MAKKLSNQCLCKATSGKFKVADIRPLVEGARFVCGKCGRAAASKGNLCDPRRL